MPFELVPNDACHIDVSNIKDVERERLEVTFENGHKLYFKVDPRSWSGIPRLLVDYGNGYGHGFEHARELRKEQFVRFRTARYDRSWFKRCADKIHKLYVPNFRWRFDGWSVEKLFDEFVIELYVGNENVSCGLAIGNTLELTCGTFQGAAFPVYMLWGLVTSIESVTLEPTPFRRSSIEGALSEM